MPSSEIPYWITNFWALYKSGISCNIQVGDRVALDNDPRYGLCHYCRLGFSSPCVDLCIRLSLVESDDEIGRLVMTVHDLPDRLAQSFHMQKNFADASHELRKVP